MANLTCSVDAILGYFKTEGKGMSCRAGWSEQCHSLSGMGCASIQSAIALKVPKQFQDTECPEIGNLCCYSLILKDITKGLKKGYLILGFPLQQNKALYFSTNNEIFFLESALK